MEAKDEKREKKRDFFIFFQKTACKIKKQSYIKNH